MKWGVREWAEVTDICKSSGVESKTVALMKLKIWENIHKDTGGIFKNQIQIPELKTIWNKIKNMTHNLNSKKRSKRSKNEWAWQWVIWK